MANDAFEMADPPAPSKLSSVFDAASKTMLKANLVYVPIVSGLDTGIAIGHGNN